MPHVKRCDCCDLPVESCGKAAERRQAELRARRAAILLETVPGARPALFSGLCPGCGDQVRKGDPIVRRQGRWTGLLCCTVNDLIPPDPRAPRTERWL